MGLEVTVHGAGTSARNGTSDTANASRTAFVRNVVAQGPAQSVSEAVGEDLSADRTTAGVVAVGSTATGAISPAEDRDWFAVELAAGRTYTIDLKGSPTSDGTLSDPYLRGVQDAEGDLISGTTNDDGGEGYNSRLTFTASESGTHYIAVGAYRSVQGTYAVAVVAVADVQETVTDPEPAQSVAEAVGEDLPAGRATAGVVAVGGTATGAISPAEDRDWFAVELVAGTVYTVELKGWQTGDGWLIDPYLHGIHDAAGNLINGTTDDNGGAHLNSRVTFEPATSGTYYIAVGAGGWTHRHGSAGVGVTRELAEGSYTLSVEAP